MSSKKQYEYIKIDGLYVRLDQNLARLSLYLLLRARPFHFHQPVSNKYVKVIPRKIVKVLRVAHFMQRLIWKKYIDAGKDMELLQAKFAGHLLIKTSNGYKVFDLKEKSVITQYKKEINNEMFDSIIRNVDRIKEYGIAPKLLWVEPNEKSYKEEYLNLYKAELFFPSTFYFYKMILPVWEKNINQFSQTQVEIMNYVQEQSTFILEKTQELLDKQYDEKMLNNIRRFVRRTAENILNESEQERINLSITHGDLHAWNILFGKNEAKLIDWDTMKERSLLHDLYYLFIHLLYDRSNIDYASYTCEMEQCIRTVWSRLVARKGFPLDLEMDVYRRIFYLEYIYLDIENRIHLENNQEGKIQHIQKINEWIRIFEKLEQNRKFPNFIKRKGESSPFAKINA